MEHGDYVLAEMLLDRSAWLCREWREIRSVAEELGDEDVQSLLDAYDVREMHTRYLRDREHRDESLVYTDETYDDSVNARLPPGQPRNSSINWDDVDPPRVGIAVVQSIATVSRMSGSWKRRRAWHGGRPGRVQRRRLQGIVKLLRGVVNPLRRVAQISREAEANNDEGNIGHNLNSLSRGLQEK